MNEMTPTIDRINQALLRLGNETGATEAHGTLVGLACAKGALAPEEWRRFIGPDADPADVLAREAFEELEQLRKEAIDQLNDPLLGLELLLPPDQATLPERIEALGEWCQGFLLGLAEGGVRDPDKLPEDSAEIVRDMVELTRVNAYELTDQEEDEEAYAELVEYVRTAALLINEELHPTKAAPIVTSDPSSPLDPPPTLH